MVEETVEHVVFYYQRGVWNSRACSVVLSEGCMVEETVEHVVFYYQRGVWNSRACSVVLS
ncbi:hypothetical protein UPYG_G00002510, partial [Umbra pygmaea]